MVIKKQIALVPFYGLILYMVFYILAAINYPGGSPVNVSSKGFSWVHNYWCNLLNVYAINGSYNEGRLYALTGMAVISVSMSVFWYRIPLLFKDGLKAYNLIRYTGIFSMMAVLFLFTRFHDVLLIPAGVFGMVALVICFIGLYRNRYFNIFSIGMVCMLILIVNNYIYYSGNGILILPVIQKISFITLIIWVAAANWKLINK